MNRGASDDAAPLLASIEAGGTKFDVMVGRSWDRPLATRRVPTSGPSPTIAEVAAFLDQCERDHGIISAVGIAAFGPVTLDRAAVSWGRLGRTPKVGWSGTDLVSPFAANGRRALSIETDVNAAAIAEARWGSGRGIKDVAYITVGTGLGVGLLLDGRPRHGMLHPEAGHIPLRRPAGDIFPGTCPFHGDCAEGLLSGPAIKKRLGRVLDIATGTEDEVAMFTDYLGQLCATLVLTTSVRLVVIGGGVMDELPVHDLVDARTRHWIGGYIDLPGERAFVVAPGLRGKSGIAGAFAIAEAAHATIPPHHLDGAAPGLVLG